MRVRVCEQMFNYEQSAMSSRAAVLALHSLAADNSPASTPDAIRTHVRMNSYILIRAALHFSVLTCVSLQLAALRAL